MSFHDILNFELFHFGSGEVTVLVLVRLCVWLMVVFVLDRVLRNRVLTRLLRRTHLPPGSQYGIIRIFGYAFLALGIYLSMQFAGIDVASLTIFAGAVGIGLGFGLQNIVSNFISGIIILVERPITLGDRVEVGKTAGTVAWISLRSTAVVTNDNITIIVPNSDFITTQVINWTHGDPKVRLRVPFGVAYGSDIEKLRSLMHAVALEHADVLRDPEPRLFFTAFGDSSLNFELSFWTSAVSVHPLRLRSDMNFAIERTLRENGYEIPFPQRDLHVRSGRLDVRVEPGAPRE